MASDGHAPGFEPGHGYTQEDWDEVSDNPEITPEQAAASRPLAEAMPELVAAMKRGRGNPRAATKDLITLRLDKDVLATLRAGGSGWQSRANEMLRRALGLDEAAQPAPSADDGWRMPLYAADGSRAGFVARAEDGGFRLTVGNLSGMLDPGSRLAVLAASGASQAELSASPGVEDVLKASKAS